MAVVPLPLDPNAEARTLLNFMLQHGDIVGTDQAGRTLLQLAIDPWTLDQLAAFDADAADLEDDDREPDGPAVILDLVPAKRIGRASRIVQALALALLLVTVPSLDARADQAPVVADVHGAGAATVLSRLPQGSALWRWLYQLREAVQEGSGLRLLGRRQARGCGMTEADQLLLEFGRGRQVRRPGLNRAPPVRAN